MARGVSSVLRLTVARVKLVGIPSEQQTTPPPNGKHDDKHRHSRPEHFLMR